MSEPDIIVALYHFVATAHDNSKFPQNLLSKLGRKDSIIKHKPRTIIMEKGGKEFIVCHLSDVCCLFLFVMCFS